MVQTIERSQFASSAGGAASAAYSFQLSDLSGVSDLSNVFDLYRIVEVELRCIPVITECLSGTPVDALLYSAVDFDDANAIAVSALEQYETCKVTKPTGELKYTIRPRAALAAYSGTFTSYANLGNMWIDMASTGVQHYGVKLATNTATNAQTWKVVCRYVVEFSISR